MSEHSAVIDLLLHPIIIGVVEGTTVIVLSSILLPLLLRRVQRIHFCLRSVDDCARMARQLVQARLASSSDPDLEQKLQGLRADLGHTLDQAFSGDDEFDNLKMRMVKFAQVLGYGDSDAEAPPPADAHSQITDWQERLKRHIKKCAEKHPTWLLLREVTSGNHH